MITKEKIIELLVSRQIKYEDLNTGYYSYGVDEDEFDAIAEEIMAMNTFEFSKATAKSYDGSNVNIHHIDELGQTSKLK